MNTHQLFAVFFAGLLIFVFLGGHAGALQEKGGVRTNEGEAEKNPIAPAGSGAVGNLLRGWYSDGTAAGNTGDYYDNRDSGHSQLDISRYPQLQQIVYSELQIKRKTHRGRQTRILPGVVFGNSSTSFSVTSGGSNPRGYYVSPLNVNFLFTQYIGNNLYIYPEHQDYDAGHNGVGGGYGDLYPINTPYLIISQGSSGTDKPFMQAVPYTLAAFRPDVKRKLKDTGFLMPVVQMLLRISARGIEKDADYLSGKAHPPVFNGHTVNTRKMVELAHNITLSNLPPMALIRVVKEDAPVFGRDYFEPGRTEKLADTPAAVGRVFRGSARTRTITVDASESKDLNGKPLKFFWRVLQGDASRIKIRSLNPEQSIAEITVHHFDRFPVEGKPGLETNRVDIGVFVHNGTYYSPPAFLTFYAFDREDRTYASDGKIVDIGYNAGSASISVADWAMLMRMLKSDGNGWAERFLRNRFSADELSAVRDITDEFMKADAAAVAAKIKYDTAAAAQKAAKGNDGDKAKAEVAAARKFFDDARKAGESVLEKKLSGPGISASVLIQKILNELIADVDFASANTSALEQLMRAADKKELAEFNTVVESLMKFGVLRQSAGGFEPNPVRNGSLPLSGNLTRFEKNSLMRLNAALLARIVFPRMLRYDRRANYVDTRLDSPKDWRDVYRYAPDGTLMGWTRYTSAGVEEFNAEGLLIIEKDAQGCCVKAQPVRYERASGSIKATPAGGIQTYSCSGVK